VEYGAGAISGLIAGTAGGWCVTMLTARVLVSAATPPAATTLDPVVGVPAGPWLSYLAAIGLAAVTVALVYGRWVRRQCADLEASRRWL
jgi:hypothetical protein